MKTLYGVDVEISDYDFSEILDNYPDEVEEWISNNYSDDEIVGTFLNNKSAYSNKYISLDFKLSKSKDDFKRILCDLLEIGYHQYSKEEILEIIKKRI